MSEVQYRKEWIASSGIARGLISAQEGERLPTLDEYAGVFECSRGMVQRALAFLEEQGSVVLERCGKQGTFLQAKNEEKLFESAGLRFLTGSMPTPLNLHLAGMATGVCQAMGRCVAPFTFAFVQGGKNRVGALQRGVYDFVIVTRATAERCLPENPLCEEAFALVGCEYSPPYVLYVNRPGAQGVWDGMTLAADPASRDQWELTKAVSAGKDVHIVEMPYIGASQAFFGGEVDGVVFREEGAELLAQARLGLVGDKAANLKDISVVPIEGGGAQALQAPVVLVNRKNYGMTGILKRYLGGELVGYIQGQVVQHRMPPQFY